MSAEALTLRGMIEADPEVSRLADELKKYLAAKASSVIARAGDTLESVAAEVTDGDPAEASVLGEAGMAGVRKLAQGESAGTAARAFAWTAVKARLRAMFGPDRTVGQKLANVLILVLAVVIAVVVLVLLLVLLPLALLTVAVAKAG